jgi:hypothetical protein
MPSKALNGTLALLFTLAIATLPNDSFAQSDSKRSSSTALKVKNSRASSVKPSKQKRDKSEKRSGITKGQSGGNKGKGPVVSTGSSQTVLVTNGHATPIPAATTPGAVQNLSDTSRNSAQMSSIDFQNAANFRDTEAISIFAPPLVEVSETTVDAPSNQESMPAPERDYSALLPSGLGTHTDCIANYYACLIGNASDPERDARLKEYQRLQESFQKLQAEISTLQEKASDEFTSWQNGIIYQAKLLEDPIFDDEDWVADYNRHVQITAAHEAAYKRLAKDLEEQIKLLDQMSARLASFQHDVDFTHGDPSGACSETFQTCEYEADLEEKQQAPKAPQLEDVPGANGK